MFVLFEEFNTQVFIKALDINSDGYISKNEMVSASIRSGFCGHKIDFDHFITY